MKKLTSLILPMLLISGFSFGQSNLLDKMHFIIGEWEGAGTGFGYEKSRIHSAFRVDMNGMYIEVNNVSEFEPTEKNSDGEHHIDKGFLSYDNFRRTIIYRQFNNEGFVNQYVLVDSLSTDSLLVFETESCENFTPGGKARWKIQIISDSQIRTDFDVSLPGKDFICYGTNYLIKNINLLDVTTPKVTGIGGIFFFSDQPLQTKEWYGKNLGLVINRYGSTFEFRNANRPDEINYLQWGPFPAGSAYFAPSKKDFMINYRVQNLEGLLEKLKANGVTIVDEVKNYDYGKFVHIMGPEETKIELWEPVDKVLTEMGGSTTR